MSRPLLLLIGGALAFWLLAGLPARMLGGGDQALVFSGAAVLLCLPPMAATLLWAGWVRDKSPADQMIMIAGSTGVRMAFVLGGGWSFSSRFPISKGKYLSGSGCWWCIFSRWLWTWV